MRAQNWLPAEAAATCSLKPPPQHPNIQITDVGRGSRPPQSTSCCTSPLARPQCQQVQRNTHAHTHALTARQRSRPAAVRAGEPIRTHPRSYIAAARTAPRGPRAGARCCCEPPHSSTGSSTCRCGPKVIRPGSAAAAAATASYLIHLPTASSSAPPRAASKPPHSSAALLLPPFLSAQRQHNCLCCCCFGCSGSYGSCSCAAQLLLTRARGRWLPRSCARRPPPARTAQWWRPPARRRRRWARPAVGEGREARVGRRVGRRGWAGGWVGGWVGKRARRGRGRARGRWITFTTPCTCYGCGCLTARSTRMSSVLVALPAPPLSLHCSSRQPSHQGLKPRPCSPRPLLPAFLPPQRHTHPHTHTPTHIHTHTHTRSPLPHTRTRTHRHTCALTCEDRRTTSWSSSLNSDSWITADSEAPMPPEGRAGAAGWGWEWRQRPVAWSASGWEATRTGWRDEACKGWEGRKERKRVLRWCWLCSYLPRLSQCRPSMPLPFPSLTSRSR